MFKLKSSFNLNQIKQLLAQVNMHFGETIKKVEFLNYFLSFALFVANFRILTSNLTVVVIVKTVPYCAREGCTVVGGEDRGRDVRGRQGGKQKNRTSHSSLAPKMKQDNYVSVRIVNIASGSFCRQYQASAVFTEIPK